VITKHRSLLILAGSGIAFYLLFLVYQFPASLGWSLATQHMKNQIHLSGLQGSIWTGSANHITINSTSAGSLDWQLSPWSLLLGRVSADIRLSRQDEWLEGQVTLMTAGRLEARDLKVNLNGETLAQITTPYLLHGLIMGDISTLNYEQGKTIQASGKIQLENADIEGPQSLTLGNVRTDIQPEGEGSQISIKNQDSPLDIKGTLKLNGNGSYRMTLGVLNRDNTRRDINRALKVLGKPDATGRIQLTYYGKLGFHQISGRNR
jgi:general secretion pathway protein N